MTIVINQVTTIETAKKIIKKKHLKSSTSSASTSSSSSDNGNDDPPVITMKLKSLSRRVAKKIMDVDGGGGDAMAGSSSKKKIVISRVRKTIVERSDVFMVRDGRHVSLVSSNSRDETVVNKSKSKKRKVTDDDGGQKKDAKKSKKEKKKKKEKKEKGSDAQDTDGGTLSDDSTSEDVSRWRTENRIIVLEGEGKESTKKEMDPAALKPMATFDMCQGRIASPLLRRCTGDVHGFAKPSPIQAQCWPVLLSNRRSGSPTAVGRDVIGIAETGSGKTLAFALPPLSSMYANGNNSKKAGRNSPRMLILAPTRELAMQSHSVLADFGSCVGASSLVVYGGVPKPPQVKALSRGVDCVVATPGRLVDLIHDGACSLRNVLYLVLDEADRMLDMGFEQDVKFIIGQCPPRERRQTAMFSATWPAAIQAIAGEYMVSPVRVYVGFEAIVGSGGNSNDGDGGGVGGGPTVDDSLSANKRVTQHVEVVDDRAREGRLTDLLNRFGGRANKDLILVFALYKKEAQRLENTLKRKGWNCASIHGDKSQEARTRAMSDFKAGTTPLLIATDVAARGLDIPNVKAVINYTFPLTIEDYVHRIGRTGRAGKTGISHTFFQPGDKSHAGELQQVMKQAGQAVPDELMAFGSTIKKKEHKLYGNFGPRDTGAPMKEAKRIKFTYSDDEE